MSMRCSPVVFLFCLETLTLVSSQSFGYGTRGVNGTVGRDHLQHNVDTLYLWAEQDNMQFNSMKFNIFSLSATVVLLKRIFDPRFSHC